MQLLNLPTDLKTLKSALPFELPGATDHGILVLHGYTGYPGDMRYLAQHLSQTLGATVHVPRWPGHGTSGRDFAISTWKDWLRRAVDSYLDLAARCDRVSVVGLSMGGVMAVILASKFPVFRVGLLAPALETNNRLLRFTPFLKFFARPYRKPDSDRPQEEDPDRQHLAREYWNWNWPGQAASLWQLIRTARKRLGQLVAPTIIVVSKKDDAVPLSVLRRIENGAGSKTIQSIVLEQSGHVVCDGVERELVASAVADFLTK